MSGPHVEEPLDLPPLMVEYYRRMLDVHTPDEVTLICPICLKRRCEDYIFALTQLIASGELK